MMLSVALLLVALLHADQPARSTIIATPSDPPGTSCRLIFQDEMFLFCARDYGRATDPGGNTIPGLFVQSKKQNRWIQIAAIATTGGRFGKSPPNALVQVSWDFTDAARRPYIDQPLRTSGSIAFPETVDDDKASDRYVLRCLSGFGASAEVVLYVARADLRAAFGIR